MSEQPKITEIPSSDQVNKDLNQNKEDDKSRASKEATSPPLPNKPLDKFGPPSLTAVTTMMSIYSTYSLPLLPYAEVSKFVPSMFRFFTVLQYMHELICDNTRVYSIMPTYHTVVSRLYYSYLVTYQILRAMNASNCLSDEMRKLYKVFEKHFPAETLSVAGPLVPFFTTLGAYQPKDSRFSWVCPVLPHDSVVKMTFPVTDVNISDGSRNLLFPNVRYLISAIELIIQGKGKYASSAETQASYYSPVPLEKKKKYQFLNIEWTNEDSDDAPITKNLAKIIQNVSTRLPYVDGDRSFGKNTVQGLRRLNIPHSDSVLKNPHSLLHMYGFDEDPSWFEGVIRQATLETTFFRGSVNLSQISPTTGPAIAIIGNVTSTKVMEKNAHSYPAFENPAKNPTTFKTLEADIDDSQLQLASLCQYSLISANGDHTTHFPLSTANDGQFYRGPYFRDHEDTFDAAKPFPQRVFAEVEVLSNTEGIQKMISTKLYEPKGKCQQE